MKQTALFPSSSSHCVKLQNLPFCQPKPRRPPICKKLSGNGSSSSSTSQNQELLSSAQLPQFSSSEVTSRTGEDGLVGGQPWPVQPCRRILYAWRGGWAKHHSKFDGLTSTSLIPKKGHSRKGKVWPGRSDIFFVSFPDFQVPARGSPTRSLEDNPSLLATVSASATAYSAKPPAGPQGESLQQVSQRPRSTQTYLTYSYGGMLKCNFKRITMLSDLAKTLVGFENLNLTVAFILNASFMQCFSLPQVPKAFKYSI